MCIQKSGGTEDCLVLTIRTADVSASRPVIVWIHGGGMTTGYCCQVGYSFDSDRTMELDAVTVNVNYRLGILGFNSIEELWEEGVYANNGIRDLITALEWIQDNIAGFGGDPNSVTIIGESGGATAVLGIVSSPLAVDKFHRAVSLSPAPEMRFNYTEGNELQQSLYGINTGLNCTQANIADRKACLMEVPAEQFSTTGPEGTSQKQDVSFIKHKELVLLNASK
jgi:carboxylesterase type B